jgi:hypothetical protein
MYHNFDTKGPTMTSIRIKIELPKPVDQKHKRTIESGLKHPVVSKVSASISSLGSGTVECTYDEKKYASVDKYKLEKELKAALGKLGYVVK